MKRKPYTLGPDEEALIRYYRAARPADRSALLYLGQQVAPEADRIPAPPRPYASGGNVVPFRHRQAT